MPRGVNLGDLLGGLTTIGSQGSTGAMTGLVEGEAARRKFASEDLQNQLRQLEAVLKGQQIQQHQAPQATHLGHGLVMHRNPVTGQITYEQGPQAPPTDLDRARTEYYQTRATTERPEHQPTETNFWAGIGQRVAQGTATSVEQGMWKLHQQRAGSTPHQPTVHYSTDAQGNVTALVPKVQPDGTISFEKAPQGLIGKPQRQPTGLVPRETVTTTTKVTPAKAIRNDDARFGALTTALPSVINEIAGNPAIQGWMQPGPLVRVDGYASPVRREDVIRHAMRRKFGADVEVQWDGKRWTIVSAREPSQREPVETRRSVGPPKPETDDKDDE